MLFISWWDLICFKSLLTATTPLKTLSSPLVDSGCTTSCEPQWVTSLSSLLTPWKAWRERNHLLWTRLCDKLIQLANTMEGLKGEKPPPVNQTLWQAYPACQHHGRLEGRETTSCEPDSVTSLSSLPTPWKAWRERNHLLWTILCDKLIQLANTMEGLKGEKPPPVNQTLWQAYPACQHHGRLEGRETTSCEPDSVTSLSSLPTPWKAWRERNHLLWTRLCDKLIQLANTMEGLKGEKPPPVNQTLWQAYPACQHHGRLEGRETTSCEPYSVTSLSSLPTPWKAWRERNHLLWTRLCDKLIQLANTMEGLKGEKPPPVNQTLWQAYPACQHHGRLEGRETTSCEPDSVTSLSSLPTLWKAWRERNHLLWTRLCDKLIQLANTMEGLKGEKPPPVNQTLWQAYPACQHHGRLEGRETTSCEPDSVTSLSSLSTPGERVLVEYFQDQNPRKGWG